MIRKFYDVDLDGRSFGNAQPSGGKSAEFEHKERLDILEKHFGSDFYKTGQWHNAISDAMEEYAQQYAHQQPVNDGWVRVEDDLLDHETEVDVYNRHHKKVITAKRLSTDKRGVNWSCEYGHYITHWRLRPEPPKK